VSAWYETRRPRRILDGCGGAGGAAHGYAEAGNEVTGVDSNPALRDAYLRSGAAEFICADILEVLADVSFMARFDFVHCSFPCHGWSAYRRRPKLTGRDYPDLITPGRPLLHRWGGPFVIENVPGAPLQDPVTLCGSSFGLDVRRHRWFEANWPLATPPCDHGWQTPRFPQATNRKNLRSTVEIGVYRIPLPVQHQAMGIDWMDLTQLSQAIPPAYTRWIAEQWKQAA
jgi:DNA (cytosine-5)-methyltransferase 1